ncbi:MAG: mechanosensitive ion channel [Anaerolineae bacterium]|jgi:small-conductance mechanosensitive channel|nr:mechanosensitive ion channel [Anaerolineae bacterium]
MHVKRNLLLLLGWSLAAGLFGVLNARGIGLATMPSGTTLTMGLLVFFAILAGYQVGVLTIKGSVHLNRGAPGEVTMLSGVLRLVAGIGVIAVLLSLFGQLQTVGTALGAFSGLLLGWSLQAPVSGMAAWIMISLKRPFRVGDRIQLPSLGLVGDVVALGPMYTELNQVGGAVGSEEAVGRPILIPNAMLFSNVVINYTARQDAAFILDEVVIRITYDTNWDVAEGILLSAAREVTADIIRQTGQEPYVRADMYDYGIYMRLRYTTSATDRPRITYQIIKLIFQGFQDDAQVDFAIPYIYSFRKGVQASARFDEAEHTKSTIDLPLSDIIFDEEGRLFLKANEEKIDELAEGIKVDGLIQPVVVTLTSTGAYRVVAGHMRVAACKRLGWRTVPAIVRESAGDIGLPPASE